MFIVMEYVEGQTLRERIGNISFKQAIEIGVQLADGLAAAHEKGIVHRDIKPENIMVRKDGIAVIMDFGLAKLRGNVSRLTKEGSTIGTAGYMSPEQVQGHDADHRSDIFSLGAVLYEMLTGQLPFKGVHETALAYEIVNVDAVPMSTVMPEIDPSLDAIILECLEKDPNERTQSVKQVSIDLKRFRRETSKQRVSRITAARPIMAAPSAELEPPAKPARAKPSMLPWIIAAVLAAGLIALAAFLVLSPRQEVPTIRAFLHAPDHSSFAQGFGGGHIAVSPDGHKVAFVAMDTLGRQQLYVQSLNSLSALPLPGTDGALYPFWSANSEFIGFFTQGKMKKIAASGGPPLSVCDIQGEGRGGSWSPDGIIVFAPGATDPVFQVPAAGGIPTQVTTLDTALQESTHRFPWFLPDGKHFLYFARIGSGSDEDRVCVASLDGTFKKKLVNAPSNAIYASGHLLYVREQTLVAQPFDLGDLDFKGNAVPIAEQLRFSQGWNRGSFSASQQGVLIYEGGLGPASNRLAMFDRTGGLLGVMKGVEFVFEASFSPDETKIAYSAVDPQRRNEDIWVHDIARSISTRLTFDPKDDTDPVWSPDGKQIAFSADRGAGRTDVYVKNADGTGTEQELFPSELGMYPTDWSQDGRFIVSTTYGNRNIVVVPVRGEPTPTVFLQTDFAEDEAKFSPDGKWLAYASNESGQREIYVRPYPGPGGKWQVSAGGAGFRPFWRRDGKEIYYPSRDGKIMVVEVSIGGGTFSVGAVKPLFEAQSKGATDLLDVSADGRKFLLLFDPVEAKTDQLTLVSHWDAELLK